jgi:hypothetical protein
MTGHALDVSHHGKGVFEHILIDPLENIAVTDTDRRFVCRHVGGIDVTTFNFMTLHIFPLDGELIANE